MTERKTGRPLGAGSRSYITGWTPAPRGEKRAYSAGKKASYAARQRRAYEGTISPVLESIIRGAPTGGVGIPTDIAHCYEGVTTPWNAFMRCEITDENLQLALAAMLGSRVWGEVLEEAARRGGMTIQQFLQAAFTLASTDSQELKSPADWTKLYGSEDSVRKRRARISRRYRGGPAEQMVRNPLFAPKGAPQRPLPPPYPETASP